jgi:streptogramin lyase
MRRSAGLAASLFLTALAVGGCGHGTVIGGGPSASPTPTVPKVLNEFSVPTAGAQPGGIVLGRDSFLYFTEQTAGKIGQVTSGGAFKEFGIAADGGTAGNNPIQITNGPDGNLWFTEQGAKPGIATMAIAGDKVTEHPVAGSSPTFIVQGPAVGTLVFSDPGNNAIGQIVASNGTVTETAIPTANANPQGLVVGPDQKVYFTEHDASKIGIFDVAAGTISEVATITPAAGPTQIVVGPDGALWYTENSVAKMGHLTTNGLQTEFALSPAASATALIPLADNFIYFADPAQNKIGRINSNDPAAGVTEFDIPSANAGPSEFVLSSVDGLLYFTEATANKIAQMTY